MTDALYVYAIAPAEVAPAVATWGRAGISEAPLEAVCAAGLAAVVHRAEPVPLEGPDERMNEWLLEHTWVVDRAWVAAGTVLPVAFNSLVRATNGPGPAVGWETAEARLRAWLERESQRLAERLERLRGRAEFRVEIGLDARAAAGADADAPRGSTGLAVHHPHLESGAAPLGRDAAVRLADQLHPTIRGRLAPLVDAIVEHRDARLGEGVIPVLVASLLARRAAAERLGVVLGELQERTPGARVRFLGPWPPYNFAGEKLEPR